ncbi:Translin [Pluteus cervinus]|uniref:Translin n=1 Tax=Pluteus cervinus TaxID=181527 RepID=A0ACD3BGS6_9AGAR|nr:Translin [Pluteus cervinus]
MISQQITQAFQVFRMELDDHNERRERLIKASRDITNLSKKVIFLLHRLVMEESTGGKDTDPEDVIRHAGAKGRQKLTEVQNLYSGLKRELEGDRFWRYERQVSPGLQEYIEALSLSHFMEHGTLITYDQVQQTLSDSSGAPHFLLPVYDYLLGLSDLTGELMRFAISGIGRRGGRAKANTICRFVRSCKADFDRFTPYIRDLAKKQAVTVQSLEKIEDAVYAVAVRTSEYDVPPELMDDIVALSVSNYRKPARIGERDIGGDREGE